jgi:hypothetical protein
MWLYPKESGSFLNASDTGVSSTVAVYVQIVAVYA